MTLREGLKCHYRLGLVLLASWLLGACTGAAETELLRISGPTMGTRYQVQIVAAGAQTIAPGLQRDIDRRLNQIEDMMSTYRVDSDISRFNRAPAGEWVEMPAAVVELVVRAQALGEASGGAFDVTVGPLVDLWGFGPAAQAASVPPADLLRGARERIGQGHLAVRAEPPALRKQIAGLRLDLSAIAKGWGVDQIAELIERHGVNRYLVEIGGELRSAGRNAADRRWRVGIELPDVGGQIAESFLSVENAAVATSGDYRNFFMVEGQRYAHVIDPRTGWPADHTLASVTVVADNCAQADALATALLVMGPEAGLQFARSRQLAVLFLLREADGFRELETESLQAYRIR